MMQAKNIKNQNPRQSQGHAFHMIARKPANERASGAGVLDTNCRASMLWIE
jgi:hypothetical protein